MTSTHSAVSATYLKDYAAPDYIVNSIHLCFQIFDDHVLVHSTADYSMTDLSQHHDIILNGENIELIGLSYNGEAFNNYTVIDNHITLSGVKGNFSLSITTRIDPYNNSSLLGFFKSGPVLCTQCEAEGFRRITYFPDRPDVLTIFTTRIEASKSAFPVLLSNGNLIESGVCDDPARHYTVWHDPFPKPCYLFALVAGNLDYIQDSFTTHTGRIVDLRIYTESGFTTQCYHAMESLKRAMAWDENIFDREYQLNRFNIVAVGDFNFGGMENTSLNIFNSALIYAHPDTATDNDFYNVESVVGHEYFHNWSGNRVTCRDWFQLSLKEGFTIFRDQEFSSDHNSRAVKRIDDVIFLRQRQFPEDASPMAHAVRPESYVEIDNMYDTTVYEKGGEIIRMFYMLLGPEKFYQACNLYFDRFDGKAVTCDDFADCMDDAAQQKFSQFRLWYTQAGTPHVTATGTYNDTTKEYILQLKQQIPPTPQQADKKPMHIPVAVGLIAADSGQELYPTKVLHLTESEQYFTFPAITEQPVPSILRGFSAPVKLSTNLSNDDWRVLLTHDTDSFNRWEASQTLSSSVLQDLIAHKNSPDIKKYLESFGSILEQALKPKADLALLARMLTLPDFSIIAQDCTVVDPHHIIQCHTQLMQLLLDTHHDSINNVYNNALDITNYSHDPESMGRRSMKSIMLRYLCARSSPESAKRAADLYNNANNMTDRIIAMENITHFAGEEKKKIFDDFYTRFENYPLVIDKWFSLQAACKNADVFSNVQSLTQHQSFVWTNPNRVRALFGTFSMRNMFGFHHPDYNAYDYIVDMTLKMDGINPFIASMLASSLKDWKRFTPEIQHKMKQALERIATHSTLSPNVYEIVSKSLASSKKE